MSGVDLEALKAGIASGSAVCLIGSGFSTLGKDSDGESLPSSTQLADELKELFSVASEDSVSLADIAECADDAEGGTRKLVSYLQNRLTVTSPIKSQIDLLSLPWRAVFTTNFDDVIERALPEKFFPITPTSTDPKVDNRKVPLYYLHGRALDVLETDKDPRFVISESNYLDLSRRNESLYAKMCNEIFCAQYLVILGYSARDMDIARRLLAQSDTLRSKTHIVISPSEGSVGRARLKKFGEVLPLDIAQLSEHLQGLPSLKDAQLKAPQFLDELKISHEPVTPEADDFIKLILRGKIPLDRYLYQIGYEQTDELVCVRRTAALETVNQASAGYINRFLISSDFGNGKSVFLTQLASEHLLRGYRVFDIKTKLPETLTEIDTILRSREKALFLVDDVIRFREVAQYIGEHLHNDAILLCTTRGDQDDTQFAQLAESLGGAVRSIDLNGLSEEELRQWDRLLERWGYWGSRAKETAEKRMQFLSIDCGAENRAIVLSLFELSKISERIDQLVAFFSRDHREHVRAFCALLISSLAQRHVSWESIVTWMDIDEAKLRHDINAHPISDLFQGGRNWSAFTSAQLADYILHKHFLKRDRQMLADTYSTIVLQTAESADDSRSGFDSRENLKELLKFRFLTRLFGADEDADRLIAHVYFKLSKASRVRHNPQFWLQYAMSRMETHDLGNAESHIEHALGLAKGIGEHYSPFQILDQRARLYIMKNSAPLENFNRRELTQAISDLSDLSKNRNYEIIYPFRAVPLIENFLEMHIDDLEPSIRDIIRAFLLHLKKSSSDYGNLPHSRKGETRVLAKSLSNCLLVLSNA